MQDLNSYIVDEAGYVVSTRTRVKCLGERISDLMDDLTPGPAVLGLFGESPSRGDAALALRRIAEQAIRIAEELEAPQRDERNSPLVGYDAAHSIA